jgi:hypothetical protein
MKKTLFFLFLFLSIKCTFAQKPLSQAAINELSIYAYTTHKYRTPVMISAMIFNSLSGYPIEDRLIIIETLKTNKANREIFLKAAYKVCGGNRTNLFDYFNGMDISAVHAKELADYVFAKYKDLKEKESTNGK